MRSDRLSEEDARIARWRGDYRASIAPLRFPGASALRLGRLTVLTRMFFEISISFPRFGNIGALWRVIHEFASCVRPHLFSVALLFPSVALAQRVSDRDKAVARELVIEGYGALEKKDATPRLRISWPGPTFSTRPPA